MCLAWYQKEMQLPPDTRYLDFTKDQRVLTITIPVRASIVNPFGIVTESTYNKQAACEIHGGRLDDSWTRIHAKRAENAKPTPASRRSPQERGAAAASTSIPSLLPEGWEWTTVGELAQVGTGATPKRGHTPYYDGGTIPWVTSGALNSRMVLEAQESVTELALRETNLALYEPGTLLLAMYGEGRTRGMCSELRIAATTNQAIAAIQVQPELSGYLRAHLERSYDSIRRAAGGGVQPNLNLSTVRSIAIALPPEEEQRRIVAEVDRRLSFADDLDLAVTANLHRASRLRQAAFAAVFSGRSTGQRVSVAQDEAPMGAEFAGAPLSEPGRT